MYYNCNCKIAGSIHIRICRAFFFCNFLWKCKYNDHVLIFERFRRTFSQVLNLNIYKSFSTLDTRNNIRWILPAWLRIWWFKEQKMKVKYVTSKIKTQVKTWIKPEVTHAKFKRHNRFVLTFPKFWWPWGIFHEFSFASI